MDVRRITRSDHFVGWGFACPAFLKCRTYTKRTSLCRQHHCKQAFTSPPLHPDKIIKRCSFHQQQGVKMIDLHQLPRFLLTRGSFLCSNSLGLVSHGCQPGNGMR